MNLRPSSVIVPTYVLSPALDTHLIHQASGPVGCILQVIETNSSLGVTRLCSYGLEWLDCTLPPLLNLLLAGVFMTLPQILSTLMLVGMNDN